MAKPRNNVYKLSLKVRIKICKLLADHLTYEEIRSDPEVKAEAQKRNVKLHNPSFLAYQKCKEYQDFYNQAKEDCIKSLLNK